MCIRDRPEEGRAEHVERRRHWRAADLGEPGDDERSETAEQHHRQVIRHRQAGGTHPHRKLLGHRGRRRAEEAADRRAQQQLHQQQAPQARRRGDPGEQRIDHEHEGQGRDQQHRAPPDPVGESPSQRDHQGHQRHRSHLHHEHLVQRQAQLLVGEGRHIHQHHVEGHRADHRQAHAHQHAAPVFAQHAEQPLALAGLPDGFEEGLGLAHVAADPQSHRTDQQTEQERHPPAPALQGLGVQAMGDQRAHPRTGEHRQALAEQLPGTVETAPVRRRAFHQESRGAGVLAAGGETLQHSRDHDQQRCADADRRVGRGEGDHRDGQRHQQDDQLHRRLASPAVGIQAEQDPTDRTHEETDTEGGQGHQQRGVLVAGREEQPGDQAGKEAVDDEVVPLQGVADHGSRHLAGTRGTARASVHGNLLVTGGMPARLRPRRYWRQSVEGRTPRGRPARSRRARPNRPRPGPGCRR
ncbi:hypothetical protein PAERUG_E16_London_17_VIM_2_04_14_06161 [Pseudomonas aeruginosa]|nr:hypothetical protein PAERUG_E16_London_17_VIM_2_04_14_06161 [Pseudomonas aeruginosa]